MSDQLTELSSVQTVLDQDSSASIEAVNSPEDPLSQRSNVPHDITDVSVTSIPNHPPTGGYKQKIFESQPRQDFFFFFFLYIIFITAFVQRI